MFFQSTNGLVLVVIACAILKKSKQLRLGIKRRQTFLKTRRICTKIKLHKGYINGIWARHVLTGAVRVKLVTLHFHFTRLLVVTKGAIELLIQGILPSLWRRLSFRSSSSHFKHVDALQNSFTFPFAENANSLVTMVCSLQAWLH